MNKRGFLATLAAMCVAPFAVKADPIEGRRKKALALSNELRSDMERAWIDGEWQIVPKPWPPEMLEALRRNLAEAGRLERRRLSANEVLVSKDHVFYDFADQDGVVIDRWAEWESPGRKHQTALGHHENGDVWSWTWTTKP